MNHFCYLRASVFKPNDPNKVSVSMQLELIKETYPDINFQVFEDRNISGTTKDRPGLNQLLEEVKKSPKGGVIYIYRWDRLARNLLLMLELFDFFTEKDFRIISIADGIPNEMLKSPAMTRLYLQTLWAFSETKVAMIKENQRIALASKREQGLPLSSKVPYGYSWQNGMAVIDTDEAEVIKQIFDWYINHDSGYGEIVVKLSEEGCMINNQAFKKHNVKGILTNPFYTGMLAGGQFESYKGSHTPIISQQVFEEAKVIRMSKQSIQYEQIGFKLRRKISCPKCKTTLTCNQQKKLSKVYRYYVCPRCKKFSISADGLEKECCQLIKRYLLESSHFKQLIVSLQKEHADTINQQTRKITSLKNEKDKLMKQFEEGKMSQKSLLENVKILEESENKESVNIHKEKLEQTLKQLIQLQKSPIDDVLFRQIEKVTLTTDKTIKEMHLYGIPISII